MTEVEQVADAEPIARMRSEVAALPRDAVLVTERQLEVVAVRADEAPSVMREVGRGRERTSRAAGEGSGRARDLDEFDQTCLQLVLWDEDEGVIGGCRVGFVDELVGRGGLSTSGPFVIAPRLLDHLDAAVELGRSFVVPEHQRSFAPRLLWRGIGEILSRSDRHHVLVGAVSVSERYSLDSRRDIAAFLMAGRQRSPWSPMTSARRPFAYPADAAPDAKALAARVVDRDGVKPPALIRQYLQVGMRGLCCGGGPAVGGGLDVLCIADLRDAPIALLERYMGEEGARRFARRYDYVDVA